MLLAVTILVVSLHSCVAEEYTSISRIYNFSETQIVSYYPWHDNTKLVYARCDPSRLRSGKRCVAVSHFHAFEDISITDRRECEIVLKPELTNGMVNDSLEIYNFGKDKVILLWMETQNATESDNQIGRSILKTSVIHVLDNCKTFEVKVHEYLGQPYALDWNSGQYFSIVTFEDTYEVVLKDVIENNCSSGLKCPKSFGLYKFDAHNRKVSGPEHWPNPPIAEGVSFVTALEPSQPNEGYVITTYTNTSVFAEMMVKNIDNYEKLQLSKSLSNTTDDGFRFSLANKAVGLCYHYKKLSIICWQSDKKGHIYLQTQFPFDIPYDTYLHGIYNLRKGGLLMAVGGHQSLNITGINDHYYLIKADTNGQLQSLEVQYEVKCDHNNSYVFMRMFENVENQYCVVLMCQSKPQKPGQLATYVNCYSSDQLSKCEIC